MRRMYVTDDWYGLINQRADKRVIRVINFSRGGFVCRTPQMLTNFLKAYLFFQFTSPHLKLVSGNLLVVRPGYPKVRDEKKTIFLIRFYFLMHAYKYIYVLYAHSADYYTIIIYRIHYWA
jgi:hypothetical protein